MTREIALHCMKSASELKKELCEECPIYGQTGSDHCYEDALQYVIAMLEQEPCDCISREAVIKYICESKECYKDDCKGRIYKRCYDLQWIYDLPPVTPQPKVGEWLKNGELCKCSNCHSLVLRSVIKSYNYCFLCGAKMEVEK